ncbi:MAG TPA: CaiB/BaiF CoA-transferase family protein [Burkholderiaceae bacterium]|nr:CaiB/BaiF CoA-transferase family protein [Burkholderiaceae bacterium]
MSDNLPFSGVRILSLAEQLPGPLATMLLADLGADVILVERPEGGDPSRRFPGLFAALNRNKRSVTIDLKSEAGRAQFLSLVDTADVVLEGFRPGVMARLGLDAPVLRARKPSLVCLSISSFGQTGPNAHMAGHDLSIQSALGMIDVAQGEEAGAALPVLPLADIASGMYAAFGIVTGLFARCRTEQGCDIDVSMSDALLSWLSIFLVPPALGLPIRPLPPDDPGYGLFGTADGGQIALSIAGEDRMWTHLCELLGLDPALAKLDEAERCARRDEIVPLLRAAIARCEHDALCQALTAARIAYGPVRRHAQVLRDPHTVARRMAVAVDGSGAAGPYVRQPLIIDGRIGSFTRPAPSLGQHNAELRDDAALAARVN